MVAGGALTKSLVPAAAVGRVRWMKRKTKEQVFLKMTPSCTLTGLEAVARLYQDPELRQSQLHVKRIHSVCEDLMVEATDNVTHDIFLR